MNKELYITTGQFAKLCGTTKETLFHYDRTGILKPAYVGENGYRYYTAVQFYDFDLIQTMKYTGSSLEDIRKCFQNFDTGYFLEIFREKQCQIREKQKELEELSVFMEEMVQMTEEALDARYDVPRIEHGEKEYLLVTDFACAEGDSINASARLLGRAHTKMRKPRHPEPRFCRFHHFKGNDGSGGRKGKLSVYKIPESIYEEGRFKEEDLYEKPEGDFAVIMHKGPYGSVRDSLEKLMEFIRKEHLAIVGDCYVYDMLSYLAGAGEEDYVVKIKVPVK